MTSGPDLSPPLLLVPFEQGGGDSRIWVDRKGKGRRSAAKLVEVDFAVTCHWEFHMVSFVDIGLGRHSA